MVKDITLDSDGVVIVVKPYGKDGKFICGLDKNYKQDTEQKKVCYAVALGLCQIAMDDPDMVYDIGLSVSQINEMENGKDNLINLEDWRKKLN
tara:strand:- start:24 stop:302 length:279 start_codon:yes stop_codon:yes gene_type:complete